MNKKLIAVAVATIMAAPVAMADVTVSGRVGGHLVSTSTTGSADNLGFDDNGETRLQFDATAGKAFARIALDRRLSTNRDTSDYSKSVRDQYLGYNFGGGVSAQFGRMAGAAKNLEKDPYIATFLQTRKTDAEAATGSNYGSSSFVDHLIQVSMNAGSAKIKVQYDAGSKSTYSPNEGHTAVSITGKASGINYWASYNNGSANGPGGSTPANSDSNTKFGASMKMGAIKVSLNLTNSDNDGTKNNATLIMADMSLGGGASVNAAFATNKANDTWMRLAYNKKLSKGVKVYAGYTNNDNKTGADVSQIGAGMTVKF